MDGRVTERKRVLERLVLPMGLGEGDDDEDA
jgi:hypothetical protein